MATAPVAVKTPVSRDAPGLDVARIREDFPILSTKVHGKPLAYFDNAATTQNPNQVLDRVRRVYEEEYSNIHRGVHYLSQLSTDAYEGARETVRRFLNAKSTKEILFLRGTTEAINLVASSYGRSNLSEGDEILITGMEHHSNIVPWQMLCEQTGAKLRVAPITDEGVLDLEKFGEHLNENTRLVAVTQVSNVLGTVNPIEEIVKMAHEWGVPVVVDGAQAAPHLPVDVQDLDCDFFAFSGHKIYGPGGIGVLYGKEELLREMPPYHGGGSMIASVSFDGTTYADLPHKYEAGTPNIAGAIGLGAAIDYVTGIGLEKIATYESELVVYATQLLAEVPGLRIIGTAPTKASVVSFVMDVAHPHDVGTILDSEGIAVRTGHHCAQPLMERMDVPATTRASFAYYNTVEEIDRLAVGLRKVIDLFGE
jgi:cysteine desulfurase/selenocysteine lyase